MKCLGFVFWSFSFPFFCGVSSESSRPFSSLLFPFERRLLLFPFEQRLCFQKGERQKKKTKTKKKKTLAVPPLVGRVALSRERIKEETHNDTARSKSYCLLSPNYRLRNHHHHGGRRRRRRAARLRGGGRGPESESGGESRRRRRKSERRGQQEERLRRHALHGIPRFPFETGTAARDRRLRLRTPERR